MAHLIWQTLNCQIWVDLRRSSGLRRVSGTSRLGCSAMSLMSRTYLTDGLPDLAAAAPEAAALWGSCGADEPSCSSIPVLDIRHNCERFPGSCSRHYNQKQTISLFQRYSVSIENIIYTVHCFKFVGINISDDLSCNEHTGALCANFASRLYFLKILKHSSGLPPKSLPCFVSYAQALNMTARHLCTEQSVRGYSKAGPT